MFHFKNDTTRPASVRKRLVRYGAGLAAAGVLAGTATLAAAPADAATTTAQPLPGCVLPAGVHWTLTGEESLGQLLNNPYLLGVIYYFWSASANGNSYYGIVLGFTTPPDQTVQDGHAAACVVN